MNKVKDNIEKKIDDNKRKDGSLKGLNNKLSTDTANQSDDDTVILNHIDKSLDAFEWQFENEIILSESSEYILKDIKPFSK